MIPLPKREKFISLLRVGTDVRRACRESGIPKTTLYRHMQESPEFKKDVEDAMRYADEQIRTKLEKEDAERLEKVRQLMKNRKR